MRNGKIIKIISVLLIIIGAIALIAEIASKDKNFYIQSIGVGCLMAGLFLINSKLTSKHITNSEPQIEEEE